MTKFQIYYYICFNKNKIMKSNLIIFCYCFGFIFFSCKENKKQEKVETPIETSTQSENKNLISSTVTDKNGQVLEMSFDNEKNIAFLKLNGEKIILQGQAAASGIWYKNDVYELRGKGQDISLEKDGKLIFEVINEAGVK